MKLNISCPGTGAQKMIEVEDEKKLRVFYDRRIAQEIDGENLGEEYNGYVFRISGGNDKQGFPMKQGVLVNKRVSLLLHKGMSCYRSRRAGERKRKSVRGCIVGPDLAVLNLVIVKIGDTPMAGVTDTNVPKRLGPKRANKLRALFDLSKSDDVRKYVITRMVEKNGKSYRKAPKIQRLVTPLTLQRKRHIASLKRRQQEKAKKDAAEYSKLFAKRMSEAKERRQSEISKRRSRNSKKVEA